MWSIKRYKKHRGNKQFGNNTSAGVTTVAVGGGDMSKLRKRESHN